MKRVLMFLFCLVSFGLVAQVIYQPHRRNAFRTTVTGFLPTNIIGLQMWFDASSIGSPTNQNGYGVTNWYDKSTNGYIASNVDSGQQPYWTNNALRLNGKPWLQFDGTDDRLYGATSYTYWQPNTLFLVCMYHNASGTPVFFGSTNATYENYAYVSASIPYINSGAYLTGYTAVTSNQWYLWECTFYGANSSIVTNGITNVTGNASTERQAGFNLGSLRTSFYLNGGIAEVLFYNTNVTSSDRNLIRKYFTDKYGPYANW